MSCGTCGSPALNLQLSEARAPFLPPPPAPVLPASYESAFVACRIRLEKDQGVTLMAGLWLDPGSIYFSCPFCNGGEGPGAAGQDAQGPQTAGGWGRRVSADFRSG